MGHSDSNRARQVRLGIIIDPRITVSRELPRAPQFGPNSSDQDVTAEGERVESHSGLNRKELDADPPESVRFSQFCPLPQVHRS